jgi:hypothetical protein
VLIPPKGKTLRIGMPANGAIFTKATHLISGKPVELSSDSAGYRITLPNDLSWDTPDTVIQLLIPDSGL